VIREGSNGALVKVGDPAELARKIDALLADGQLRARLGAQARRDIEQNYNPGVLMSRIVDVYREVQESRR
jgi:glycosyltransferase involved in cell wall biosynthesis